MGADGTEDDQADVPFSQAHLREAVEKLAEYSPTVFPTPVREAEQDAAAKLSSVK